MAKKQEPLRKEIAASGTLKKVMADHFYELDEAARTGFKKIAWCTSVGPAELLRGMGFLVYFPENHGAMLGATRMATDLIPYANAMGYSPILDHISKRIPPLPGSRRLSRYPSLRCLFSIQTSAGMCKTGLPGIQGNLTSLYLESIPIEA